MKSVKSTKYSILQFKVDLVNKNSDGTAITQKRTWKKSLSMSKAYDLMTALNDRHAENAEDILVSYVVTRE